jgi:hypothetical protein
MADSPINNGPNVTPLPPGPQPTGPYEYIMVPALVPVPPNASYYAAFGPFQQIEQTILFNMSTADKIDLVNGARVYRVLTRYLWRFDHDKRGPFIGRPPLPQFRFVLDDPTLTVSPANEWEPING